MKNMNIKGFTLIELLAVIVVLSIILIITIPTVLNSLSTVKQDALQSSAKIAAKTYKKQLDMIYIGQFQDGFIVDAKINPSTGKIVSQRERCISVEEARILGLNKNDYSINTECKIESNVLTTNCDDISNYSTVTWNMDGKVTVKLIGQTDGKFVNGDAPLVAISNSNSNQTLTHISQSEKPVLTNTAAGKEIENFKIYGNTTSGVGDFDASTNKYNIKITVTGKNLFNEEMLLLSLITKNEEGYVNRGYPAVYNTTNAGIDLVNHLKMVIKPNITYTLSRKVSNYISASSGLMAFRNSSGALVAVPLGNGIKSKTFSLTQEEINSINNIYIYGRSDNPTIFHYIQLEVGTEATAHESYKEPATYTISINEPLRSNDQKKDYIDFELGKIIRWIDSSGNTLSTPTEEDITLPTIKTLGGTTIITSDTNIKPSYEGSY